MVLRDWLSTWWERGRRAGRAPRAFTGPRSSPRQLAPAGLEARLCGGRDEANPYDGRHSYASLLIHEGRSPLSVAAAMGHSSAKITWEHYVHLFEGVRDGERVPMEEAIARARVRPVCVEGGPRRHLRLVS